MKLACVIHRYGPEATGGSEAHCRAIATRLAERHDVTVLTSCATDYLSWRNALPAGESRDGRVRVLRFPVERERHLHRFREISDTVFDGGASEADQTRWFVENGPRLPGLLDHLRAQGAGYDRVLFWSFRYYPAFFGLPLVADRAILVPTAEEDDLIYTATLLRRFFTQPRGYLFLTPEEQELVAGRAGGPLPPAAVIGTGLDPAAAAAPDPRAAAPGFDARFDVRAPFALYVGRVERNKGCERLLDDYRAYRERFDDEATLPLVLAGPVRMPVPDIPSLHVLGFVPDTVRDALLSAARLFVMPSPFESLNIALLEAWNHGTPALINGRCRPLKGQVRRADGGLYYDRTIEFVQALRYFATHADEARQFGRQGLAYVDREYRWPVVMEKIEALLALP
jgi:glycosyltransferase involved in cell wall biosynthesis